jgi:Zn-dependent protease
MTVHEFAHNYGAYIMGDPTPKYNGRLTLNPLVHINWVGWIMFALIGFGILGSAPIAPERLPLHNRRWRWLVAVAAGPVSNLILATVLGIIIRIAGNNLPFNILLMAYYVIFINVVLFLFNLIPLFPIDGWQIVLSLLPPDLAYVWKRYQQESYYLFIALIFLGFALPRFSILAFLVSGPAGAITSALVGL